MSSISNLKERTLRGGLAKICSQGASFVLRVGSLMVLARLLDPKDFGLVGMVTVVTGVFGLFRDAGLSMATVQRPTISHEQVSTLFWINILVGVVLALATVAMAPLLVAFYHESRIYWVTMPLAAGFVFNAAGVQHSALLQRQMRFAVLAAIDVIALVVSIAIGIGTALAGFGYWSLVLMTVSQPAAATICVWLTAAWYPGLPSRSAGVGSMIRFGSGVTFNSLIVYVAYNVDKVLLGRLWGAEVLGVYGRAYQLINIPTDNLNSAIGGVAVSALARLQHDHRRFKSYFLKGYSLVLVLTIPVTAACALFADDIIPVLLGPKWQETISIFRLLAPTIMAFALINPLAWLLFSSGQIKRSVKMALVIAPLVIASYFAGLPYGANGVAFGYSAMMTLLVVPMIAWAIQGSIISPQDIWSAVNPPLLSAIAAAITGLGVKVLCAPLSPLLRLVLEGSALVACYVLVLLFVMGQKTFYIDVIRDFRSRSTLDTPAALESLA